MVTLAEPHPIADLIGIGPAIATELEQRNVRFERDLLAYSETDIVNLLEPVPGVTEGNLLSSFIPQARLLRLPDVSPELAHALVELGYRRYSDLFFADLAVLTNRISDLESEGSIASAPSQMEILELVLSAGQLAASGAVVLSVLSQDNQSPIENAEVRVNGTGHTESGGAITKTTDSSGRVFFEDLAPTQHPFRISALGFITSTVVVSIRRQSTANAKITLKSGQNSEAVIDEFVGELVIPSPTTERVRETVPLQSLNPVPPFYVRDMSGSSAFLASLWFRMIGDTVFIPNVTIPLDELPTGLSLRDVILQNNAGAFEIQSGVTPEEFRAQFVAERLDQLYGGT